MPSLKKQTRVLQVTKLYHPWIGGVEKHVQDLSECLKDRFEISVLCCAEPSGKQSSKDDKPYSQIMQKFSSGELPLPPDPGTSPVGSPVLLDGSPSATGFKGNSPALKRCEIINGIPVYKAPCMGLLWSMPISFSFIPWLNRFSKQADVVHLHFPFPLTLFSSLFLNRRPAPKIIITWHSDIVRQKAAAWALTPLLRRALGKAQHIIVTSRNALNASKWLGPYRDKCRIIPLGIDLNSFQKNAGQDEKIAAIRQKYGNATLALFVGRLVPYKGIEYLIHAAARLDKPPKILIIGDGPQKQKLMGIAGRLGLNNVFVFLGAQDRDSLLAYYHACDFLILPSAQTSEAFGLTQVEAMICGKPVINTNLPTGVPEVSLDGETGLTVEPANAGELAQAIKKLAGDEKLRLRLGRRAKERAQRYFSRELMAQKIAPLYSPAE